MGVLRRWRLWLKLLAILAIGDLFYVAGMWPDWDLYARGPVPRTAFMIRYEHARRSEGWPSLRWRPVPLERIPKSVIRAVIVGEDSRFWRHSGVDPEALEEALEYNLSRRRLAYGASTISQQTVKNYFFEPNRNPLRKWHELLLTLGMERNLEKRRILELYLNVAEFGPGIYGVEAASRAYWGIPASRLSALQAVELAATLPSPRKHNPRTRTERFTQRAAKLTRQIEALDRGV